ncbi:GNAT family N-acetyltransferase [Microbacteriaceae bacterium K1510]|nr:GNAT family N-acetyltransferase [Microbacteriaceae bacterium K1510]
MDGVTTSSLRGFVVFRAAHSQSKNKSIDRAVLDLGRAVVVRSSSVGKRVVPSHGDSRADIHLELFNDMSAVEPVWRAFEQCADFTVFQRFDWLSEWHAHVGRHRQCRPVIVLARDEHGKLLTLLPLAIERERMLRRLTWFGSDLCDYNAPMLTTNFNHRVPPDRFKYLWRQIVAAVREAPQHRFDMIDMDKMPERVGAQVNPMFNLSVLPRTYGAHATSLGDNWEDFCNAKTTGQTRKRDRRRFRRLTESGEVRFIHARDHAEIADTMDVLINQKRNYFARKGVEDLFTRAGYGAFYRAVVVNPNLRDVVHVSRVDVSATPVAAGLGLMHKDCYHLVMSSYQDGDMARFGPGRVHLMELFRHAIERRAEKFDFTIGDEPYKRDWCDIELKLVAYLEAATAMGGLMVAARTAIHRGELFVREKPKLRRPLSKVRLAALALRRRLRRKAKRQPDGPQ